MNRKEFISKFLASSTFILAAPALNKRDGFGIWNTNKIEIQTESNTKILLLEVPMTI